ncbi:MAG TPA: adenylate/guanylate cyclase domain-containing protein, partial [Candidatus Ozemobacteraceae bacterium]|nr:adenylate/guanylate cyclase domain-containing protein [Candidatus Ozemobacteraceae bacterium]
TTTFLIIEPYATERYEVRAQEIRAGLRSTIKLLELQSLSHRPRLWHVMSQMFYDPAFLEAARRDAAGTRSGAEQALQKQLHDKFMYLYEKPLDVSLRKLIIAGMGNYVRDQARPGDSGGSTSMLPQLLSLIANEAISARGGVNSSFAKEALAMDNERGSAAKTKREMLWDVGREMFLAILGPESFFDWLNGKNEPLLIEVGLGMVMIYEILLPQGPQPEFLLTILLKAEFHENKAMARTLSGRWRDGPVFVFQRDFLGEPSQPESGERHPFLRRIARQIDAAAKPLSLRLSDGNTSWLIEGAPGEHSRQFIFTAVADEAPLRAETESIKRRLTAMLLIAALITLLIAASATQDVVSPINRLIEGIRAISAGTYSYRVDVDRSDELGELAGAFNTMAGGLEERNILSHMVSGSALNATTSQDYEAKAREGRRHTVIVCFVSFVGAEAEMAAMTPEEALSFLNRQVVAACRILHSAGADIDKLLGPKILALFPPELGMVAVETARALQTAHGDGQLDLRPAIGLTRGPVISGILGSGDRRDHTVIGDTVNLAARAASIAEKLEPIAVVLDDALRTHIGDIGEFESLGETFVKGKT